MRKKRGVEKDDAQSSLDAFSQVNIPKMPDLDSLARADKILKKEINATTDEETEGLNTFEMPSMSPSEEKPAAPSGLIYHDLEKLYSSPPIKDSNSGLVVHRAVLNDITGCSTLLNWLSDGHAAIVEMNRLVKRETEFSSAINQLHTFIEGDLGGQIIQITDSRLMLLPPGCRGVKGIEMEAFAASAEELGRRRL
ncbi:MAG: hypothetical protein P8Q95_07790 [Candidatus Poseidoniaceae archaeon]|nr:hypothetical protein [Candidatus Poseidoniaceae archaeon]